MTRKLRMLLNQLEQFFQEYLGERNRMRQEVDRAYEPRRQQKEAELEKKTGQRVQINPQNDPEYVGLMRQQLLMVDDRYGQVLAGRTGRAHLDVGVTGPVAEPAPYRGRR